MISVFDVETSFQILEDGSTDPSAKNPDNFLVSLGINDEYIFFKHRDYKGIPDRKVIQDILDKTTLLVGHNIKFDLLWLWESGFKYDGAVFDTMLVEYVLQRGIKEPLSLEACAERYELDTKKQDTLKEYFKKGYSTRDIPYNELCEYLSADLHATQQLSDKLWYRLNTVADTGLLSTARLTNRVAKCLTAIYQRGFAVDISKLDEVRTEFEQEKKQLVSDLQSHVRVLMGDTPINLNSPEQLSWVIYSRKVIDKPYWGNAIDPYMADTDFRSLIAGGTERIHKTVACLLYTSPSPRD